MIFKLIRGGLLRFSLIASMVVAGTASAQYTSDIDIYGGAAIIDAPNVLIMLDNTANWSQNMDGSTAMAIERQALIETFDSIVDDKVRVGLMMFTETGGGNNTVDGGYVRAAIRTLSATYKTKFADMLNSLHVTNDRSNGGKTSVALEEAYRYFTGKAPLTGNGKVKTDYTGNVSGNSQSNAVYAQPLNALASIDSTVYLTPQAESCTRGYIIYISNGPAQENNSDINDSHTRLSAAYTAAGMTRPTPRDIALSPSGSQTSASDEWSRFMKINAGITIYVVDIQGTTGQQAGWSAVLKSIADQSGGEYFPVLPAATNKGAKIKDALYKIFNQVQAVNSVFASASLPVSVNARGSYLNQVFMGMFRPDSDGKPRWRGNLKQYQFNYDVTTDNLFLADTTGASAISGATGFINSTAVSHWTSTSTFWINQTMGTPPSASDLPDGEVVEKGGAAQRVRETYAGSQTSRKVLTCISCAANTNLATDSDSQFATSTVAISTTTLGGLTTTERELLINWVRGADNNPSGLGREWGPGGTVTIRPSAHGDVLHSRPAVVNYGGTTGVMVFYGTNDGSLRAVNGNQTGSGAGEELWNFIPEEHFSKLKRLRDNDPEVRLSTTVLGSSTIALPRDYFVDGPIGVYQKLLANGNNEKVYIYVTMRRGGRVIYALDVTVPTEPKFLWKKTSADIAVLGQTWSEPKPVRVRGHANPVIIMGAGYDATAEDISPQGTTTMGNAVLVLDAFTGTVVKSFATERSVPSDVTLMDSDFDGYVDRAYVGDMAGKIYRIDFETAASSAVADWGHYTFASLSGGGTRKFFYPPDVVQTPTFVAVLPGSGDREKPLATTGTDAFFTIFDMNIGKGAPSPAHTTIVEADLPTIASAGDTTKGCRLPMASGEKIVNAPLSSGGNTYFGTNKPVAATLSCRSNLGEAKLYAAPQFCRAASSQIVAGGGLPPSPVSGVVTLTYTNAEGQTVTGQKRFIIGAPNPKASAIEGSLAAKVGVTAPTRRYWFIENPR